MLFLTMLSAIWPPIRLLLVRFFTSLKVWTAIVGALSVYLAKKGIILDPSIAGELAMFAAVLLGAQGLADHGKEKAKVEAARDMAYMTAPAVKAADAPEEPASEKGFIRFDTICLMLFVSAILVAAVGTGCGWLKKEGTAVKQRAIACSKAVVATEIAQWTPMVKQVVARATTGEGKIDWPSIDDATSALTADAFCVVRHTVQSLLKQAEGAVMSAGVELDKEDAAAGLEALQRKRFPDVVFRDE
jgi:hypothetical protein